MAAWPAITLWGLIASGAMATVLEGSRLLGFSRMSLPFLFGAFFTMRRARAMVLGYVAYLLGGWVFAVLYALVLEMTGGGSWWAGGLIGLAHGVFLVTVFLPLLPFVHPNIATHYDGPSALTRLEPPGPFGLNYGHATPVTTLAAQVLFGVLFGAGYALSAG
ncbi:hypothetical protein D6850_16820 [Roseovarius spongiae]|uniref:Uncharacterized protein n=2 Tax=Roseovarius spongiae TaxID=2320272 RepID=A0A3A8B426_9RHOB|nr:hypothetical protein D6850_16820 [Roseovarius spongiae]